MRLIISVVSHLHQDIIINLNTLNKLASLDDVVIICRDNIASSKLQRFCKKNHIYYLANTEAKGFSENNNLNFQYYQEHLRPSHNDFFMLLNPDVVVTNDSIQRFMKSINKSEKYIYTVNMYLDKEFISHDDNVRTIPKFHNFIKTYLFQDRSTMVDRRNGLKNNGESDDYWVSGAFLAVKQETYKKLRGLDECYYLYCEDIDFAVRANKIGYKIKLIEDVKAVHFRQRKSRGFFSEYFFFHVKSVFLFCMSKYGLKTLKSSLK